MLKTDSAPTDFPGGGFPWTFFLSIFVLSAPLWLLASFHRVQLMPGLPISALMFLTCPIVACAFTWRVRGLLAMRRLLLRVFDFGRIPSRIWYVLALLLMPCVLIVTYIVMRIVGMPLPNPQIPWLEAPMLFGLFLLAATGEELAWSGTVLEPLQARWGWLQAALVIGVASALWHIIPFAQANNPTLWIVGQCFFTVAFRVVIVGIYKYTSGSVFAASVTHASYNLGWQLFPNRGSGYDPWITTVITVVVAIVLLSYVQRLPTPDK